MSTRTNNFNLPSSPFQQASQPATLDGIFAYLKESDARMSSFIRSQNLVNNEISAALKDIPQLIQAVASDTEKIAALEHANAPHHYKVNAFQSRVA